MQDNGGEIVFERELEVNELLKAAKLPLVKIIIGLRRAGKSYLLNKLFYKKLIDEGYSEASIIKIDLISEYDFIRSPLELKNQIYKLINANTKFLFIDEIQLSGEGYADILISFIKRNKNISVYVTGSNSHALSDDIRKAFKEHGMAILLRPLPFESIRKSMPEYSVEDYFTYGSLPIVLKKRKEERLPFLKELYEETYFSDIKERCKSIFLSEQEKSNIITSVLSNIMTPLSEKEIIKKIVLKHRLGNDKVLILKREILDFITTVSSSFLLIDYKNESENGDNSMKDFIDHDIKKYCFDLGLLNIVSKASINKKNSSILENAILLELLSRGINSEGCQIQKTNGNKGDVDFSFMKDGVRYYLQAAFTLDEANKDRELGNFSAIKGDAIKIIVCKNNLLKNPEHSIKIIDIRDFLLDKTIFNLN